MRRGVGVGIVLRTRRLLVLTLLGACAVPQAVHVYPGPPLPRGETSLLELQADANLVKLRIEAVDGVRLPGANPEFHARDRGVVLRPGPHTIEVRGWFIADVGSDVVLPEGERGNYVLTYTFAPRILELTTFAGRDYEIQARPIDFDTAPRNVAAPLFPAERLLLAVVERPSCPDCQNTSARP